MSTQDKEVERMFMQKVDEDCFVDISQVIEHPPVSRGIQYLLELMVTSVLCQPHQKPRRPSLFLY